MSYWIPGGLFGFGGNPGWRPEFEHVRQLSELRRQWRVGGGGFSRSNLPNGWFVGGEGGGTGVGMSGINQVGAFGSSFSYQGVQFGYNFKNEGSLPVTVYAGFDNLKYNTEASVNLLGSFDNVSGTAGYSAHAGVEFKPTSNVSLSLGFGYTQQSGRLDSDINSSSLPGVSAFAAVVRAPR